MEYLNKVQLVGRVGYSKSQAIGSSVCTRFSLATNYTYKDKDGNPVIETTWHNCVSFDKNDIFIKKGDTARVEGRIKANKYIDSDGKDKISYEIIVSKCSY